MTLKGHLRSSTMVPLDSFVFVTCYISHGIGPRRFPIADMTVIGDNI